MFPPFSAAVVSRRPRRTGGEKEREKKERSRREEGEKKERDLVVEHAPPRAQHRIEHGPLVRPEARDRGGEAQRHLEVCAEARAHAVVLKLDRDRAAVRERAAVDLKRGGRIVRRGGQRRAADTARHDKQDARRREMGEKKRERERDARESANDA